jgi:copper chaperone CopZ
MPVETLTLELPAMYGDHHVVEVRRLLLEMPGITDVYASSSFRAAEITFDPTQVDAVTIKARLEQAGYLGELDLPMESGEPAAGRASTDGVSYFRHSAAFETVGNVVSFAQQVPYSGRPLWPCPGMGTIKIEDEGK